MFYVLSFILDSIIQTSSLISIIEWHVQYVEGKVNRHNKVTMINFWIGIVFVLSECKKDFWSCDGKRKQGKKTEKPYISKSDRALHLIRDSFFFLLLSVVLSLGFDLVEKTLRFIRSSLTGIPLIIFFCFNSISDSSFIIRLR